MDTKDKPAAAGQVEQPVRPAAWLHRQGNHTEAASIPLDDDERSRGWTDEPLVTMAQAQAMATAERKRVLEVVEQRLHTWRQRMMNKSGDRLSLDDFMGQESIDDLIDYVCDEWA